MEEQRLAALEVLNTVKKQFQAKANKLRRQVSRMSLQNLEDRENSYKELEAEIKRFQDNLDTWEDTLPVDEDGDIIYPEAGDSEAGADYNPEWTKMWLSNFQKELHEVRKEFIKFKSRECVAVQIAITEQATLNFIKDTPMEATIKEELKHKEKDEDYHVSNRIDVDHEVHGCRIDEAYPSEDNVKNVADSQESNRTPQRSLL